MGDWRGDIRMRGNVGSKRGNTPYSQRGIPVVKENRRIKSRGMIILKNKE